LGTPSIKLYYKGGSVMSNGWKDELKQENFQTNDQEYQRNHNSNIQGYTRRQIVGYVGTLAALGIVGTITGVKWIGGMIDERKAKEEKKKERERERTDRLTKAPDEEREAKIQELLDKLDEKIAEALHIEIHNSDDIRVIREVDSNNYAHWLIRVEYNNNVRTIKVENLPEVLQKYLDIILKMQGGYMSVASMKSLSKQAEDLRIDDYEYQAANLDREDGGMILSYYRQKSTDDEGTERD